MATAVSTSTYIQEIGETAGLVWHTLEDEGGPISLTQLVKRVEQPRDMVMQAVGWLGREEKIAIIENGRTKQIALCEYLG